jgi:hypothetical protein
MQFDPEAGKAMIDQVYRSARRSPWMQLLSALMNLAGGRAELIRHVERPWASVTFSGSRHTVLLGFTGGEAVAAGETFIAALPDHEFTIPRQLVADAVVLTLDHVLLPEPRLEVEVEILLLEDA